MNFFSRILKVALNPAAVTTLVMLDWVSPAGCGEPLRAAAAARDITPPTGHTMWGYADRHDAPSQGVADRLYARALVLEVGPNRVALVSLDLGRAPARESMERIRVGCRRAGVGELFLVASHTHHGPVLELDDWPNPENSYVRRLEQDLIDLIRGAAGDLRPARWGVASEEVPWNHNRHARRPDAPLDPLFQVARFETTDGNPIAHLVHFAAHPTMLPVRMMEFSADFPGSLSREVERQTAVPCLFLQGAAGDLSVNPPPGYHTPERFGRLLAGKVIELDRDLECEDRSKNSLRSRAETFRFKTRLDLNNVFIRQAMSRAFFPELVVAYEREYREGVRPVLTTALLDERLGFVGVSGELFCAHALRLRERAGLPHLFVMGFCNDYHQYFPTIEASAAGGYGAVPPVAMAEVGAGERIMDAALIHLFRMRDRLTPLNE